MSGTWRLYVRLRDGAWRVITTDAPEAVRADRGLWIMAEGRVARATVVPGARLKGSYAVPAVQGFKNGLRREWGKEKSSSSAGHRRIPV